MKKTYKSFGESVDELRVEHEYSYDRLALAIGMTSSHLYSLINRRIASAPEDKILIKIAKFFNLEPEYFFEYRLRKMIKFVQENKEFLDHCEKELPKWLKKESQESDEGQDSNKTG